MPLRTRLNTLIFAATLLVVFVLILGQILGQPILIGFVTTGSMEPTLEPGDGFVAIPTAVTGPPEESDVVTFRAKHIQGGGLTTHRIVDETDRGYVTKGDANPFLDQGGDEPPVKSEQIVAIAWQPGGKVLVIPAVGTVVTGTRAVLSAVQTRIAAAVGSRSLLGVQGLAYLFFGLTLMLYVIGIWRDEDSSRESRDHIRDTGTNARLLVGALAVVVVLAATAAMVAPAGPQELGVVSAEFDSSGPRVVERGTTETTTYAVGNSGVLPVITYLESGSDHVTVQPGELAVPRRSVKETELTVSAPSQTGYYRYYITEHRYLALLPQSTIRTLYHVHPWVPIVVIDALLGVPFYLVGVSLVGTGRIRNRKRERNHSTVGKVRRGLQRLYR